MSNDIATISLRVNTTELERGNQALDRFQETASAAAGKADDLNSTFRTGIDNQKKNSESLKQQRQELQNLLNKISPVNKALDELDTIQESLSKFRSKGLVGDEDFTRYNSVLETTRAKLAQVMESETAEGRARIEQAQAAQRATAAGKTFIDSLEDQVAAIGKTRAELLELKAAQLGVSDRAAPMIARLKEQEESWKSGAISAGQYRNAMRYLPMQMTDIVTSLASGMPVYMVAIQQGGQLRDSFGGVGNALKAMLSMVTPARVAIGGLAGAVLIAAKAGSDYFTAYDEINKAIIRTGNIAGTSALQIMASSQSISASTGATVGTVQSLMTELVGIGSMTQQQLEKATKATALAVETGIVSAQDITKAYKDIDKDPVKALQNLNEQFNFLTVSQLKHIDELVKQKDQTAAVTQAMDLFGDTMAERGEQAYDSLTPFGRLWLDIKGWASEAMQSIGQWVAELASNTLKEFNAIYYSVAIVFQKLNQIISSSIAAAINLVPDWAKTDTLQGWQDYNEQMAGAYGNSLSQLKKDWKLAQKGSNGAIPISQGGTGATTAEDSRTNLGLGSSATKNVGTSVGNVMEVGAFGFGGKGNSFNADTVAEVWANLMDKGSRVFRNNKTVNSQTSYAASLYFAAEDTHAIISVAYGTGVVGVLARNTSGTSATSTFNMLYGTANTTRASDGTLKAASPVVAIFSDGSYRTNDESEGCTVTRLATGQYLVEGCQGLNSDAAWGGIDGGFDIPTDRNKQPLIWLDYEVNANGSLLVKTYHRTHPDAPAFGRNEIDGVSDGEPGEN